MYKHLLESAGNINWMAVMPLLIFVVFFIGIVVFTVKRDKHFIQKMAEMPLKDDSENPNHLS
jgi:cbb3-type cytochrome oxidase subunit 3